MREISEESVSAFLENKEALAPCNVAAFVYDRYVKMLTICYSVCSYTSLHRDVGTNIVALNLSQAFMYRI